MPSIELLDRSAHSDGHHDVRSPGGYEWWYFDAEDARADTQVVAIFMQGFIFHPGYLRAYERFRRKPTSMPPPVGADFPCAYLCVYRDGKVAHQFFTQVRPEQFEAAKDRVDVRLGANRLWVDDAGAYRLSMRGTPWTLTGRGPRTWVDRELRAELTFAPRLGATSGASAIERPFLSRDMTGADHRWTIAAPRCEASGTIELSGGAAESIPIAGRGYHDHNYGTAPIGDGLARWTWGRAMFEGDRVVTFHHAEPTDRSRPPETHLVVVDAQGPRDVPVDHVSGDWSLVSNPALRLRYPKTLDFGDALRLSNPRVVDPTPFYLRLTFDAVSYGERSTAFCEIAYPHRSRWPILGRMIEMSFDKRALG